jgi:hypothetical protein
MVDVRYQGPAERLPLHVTTDPILFVKGEVTTVPEALVDFLKTLPHGFEVLTPAPEKDAGVVALEAVEPEAPEAPAPEVEPDEEEPEPAPKTRKRKAS